MVLQADSDNPARAARRDGRARRETMPRASQAKLGDATADRDPVKLVRASDKGRIRDLIGVRHARMLASPFAFFRGTAGLQAQDLASSPSSGLIVQCCGDAHLMNFGGFATPERRLIFDLNDFDETCPAPFEWDVKRLATSLVLAARWRGFSGAKTQAMTVGAVTAYREHILAAADATTLETWYATVTWAGVLEAMDENARAGAAAVEDGDRHVRHILTTDSAGSVRLRDQPPLLYHPPKTDQNLLAGMFLSAYATSLRDDVRNVFARFRFADAAIKVVGVGSVGLHCYIALLLGNQSEPLFLQIKQARPSVLGFGGGPPIFDNQGARVVAGQRLMQSASDLFLGWAKGPKGLDFYVRQARDIKASIDLEAIDAGGLAIYGRLCGQTLARAHAKGGKGAVIAGYLGKGDAFDQAVGRYASAYADQVEADHAAVRAAMM